MGAGSWKTGAPGVKTIQASLLTVYKVIATFGIEIMEIYEIKRNAFSSILLWWLSSV